MEDISNVKTFCSGYGQYHSANNKTNQQDYLTITWDEIIEMVHAPQDVSKETAQWALASTHLSRNLGEQIEHGKFYLLWFDVDKAQGLTSAEIISRACDVFRCDFVIYTSKSATVDNPKCRILIKLPYRLNSKLFTAYQTILNDRLEAVGIVPDRKNQIPNQILYLPNRGEYYESFVWDLSGPFDPDSWAGEIISYFDKQEAAEKAQAERKEVSRIKAAERLRNGSISVIDAFNAAYDEELLFHEYGYQKASGGYISPNSESRKVGVKKLDNGKHYSHHESDAALGIGGQFDSFDLFRVYEHQGDLNAALRVAGDMFRVDGKTITELNDENDMRQKTTETAGMFENIDTPSDWGEPEPIRAELLPVEPLHESMIPEPLLPMIKDVAYRMSVPLDFVAVPLIVAIGSVIGTGCRIRPKRKDDWEVTPNLWGALVGDPSMLKTPAMDEVIRRTLGRLEADEAEKHKKERDVWAKGQEAARLKADVLKQEYKAALKKERK